MDIKPSWKTDSVYVGVKFADRAKNILSQLQPIITTKELEAVKTERERIIKYLNDNMRCPNEIPEGIICKDRPCDNCWSEALKQSG